MTRKQTLSLARSAALRGDHSLATRLFATQGISYISATEVTQFLAQKVN